MPRRRRLAAPTCLLLGAATVGACRSHDAAAPTPEAGPRFRVERLETPAAPGSGEPNLSAGPGGRVYLSWVETAADGVSTLRFASRARGGAWTAPASVARGYGWFVNWADLPSLLALPDGTLFAHWLAKSVGGGLGYEIRIVASRDGGATWSRPVTPHRDGSFTDHGFASLAPAPGGGASVAWLDGRGTSEVSSPDAAMMLLQTTLDATGRLGPEVTLDTRVCDCCQTASAATDAGLVVVYRDRSPREIRDIVAVRSEGGAWSAPVAVHADGWEMNGCPINGPAVAARGGRLAVAWFTAAGGTARVNVAFSSDGARTFGPPIAVDDGRPGGRVDVALLPDGSSLVSWIEQAEAGPRLRVRPLDAAGRPGPAVTVADQSSARSSGFPHLEAAGDEPVLVWRDVSDPPRLASARLVRE